MSNNKISDVGINIAEKATVIWNVADLRPDFQKLVIASSYLC